MTYKHDFKCSNCEVRTVLDIPKGTTIKEFLSKHVCSNCGCGPGKDVNGENFVKILEEMIGKIDDNKVTLPWTPPEKPIPMPFPHHGKPCSGCYGCRPWWEIGL